MVLCCCFLIFLFSNFFSFCINSYNSATNYILIVSGFGDSFNNEAIEVLLRDSEKDFDIVFCMCFLHGKSHGFKFYKLFKTIQTDLQSV